MATWQELPAIIKSSGYMAPLCEGEVLVTPLGLMTMQLAVVDSLGLRWGVGFPLSGTSAAKQLTDFLLAYPSLAQQGYDDLRRHQVKLDAASAPAAGSSTNSSGHVNDRSCFGCP